MLDGPIESQTQGVQKIVQLPSSAAKSPDIADRAHRHFHKTCRVQKRLRLLLCCHNRLEYGRGWSLARLTHKVGRILAAYPGKTLIQKQPLYVLATCQPIGKATGCAEAGGLNAQALLH